MTTEKHRVVRRQLRLSSTPSCVREARVWAAEEAALRGLGTDAVDAVRLALSEAVANVVMHAYPGTVGPVTVSVRCGRRMMRFQVQDEGCGRAAAVPGTAGAGLGTSLMQAMCDEFEVLDGPLGTRVLLGFRLPA